MNERFIKVTAIHNEQTKLWWEVARQTYREYPQSIPEAVHPLVDEAWNDEEIIATKSELKDIQAWAIGVPGWISAHPALRFSK